MFKWFHQKFDEVPPGTRRRAPSDLWAKMIWQPLSQNSTFDPLRAIVLTLKTCMLTLASCNFMGPRSTPPELTSTLTSPLVGQHTPCRPRCRAHPCWRRWREQRGGQEQLSLRLPQSQRCRYQPHMCSLVFVLMFGALFSLLQAELMILQILSMSASSFNCITRFGVIGVRIL